MIPIKSAHWARNPQSWSILNHQDQLLKCFLKLFLQYMPGFKSRWIILNLCKYWIPCKIDFNINEISPSLNFLLFCWRSVINCFNVPPGIYYMIKYKLESVYLNELNLTTFLCSIEAKIYAYFLKLFNLCLVKSFLWNT